MTLINRALSMAVVTFFVSMAAKEAPVCKCPCVLVSHLEQSRKMHMRPLFSVWLLPVKGGGLSHSMLIERFLACSDGL